MVYPITNREFLKLFTNALRIRLVEEEIAKRYSQNKMRCPTHLSIGQEIVPAIYSLFVNKKDFAISTHRGHAHYLAKGGNLKKMIAELYGKSTGCSSGKGGSMHLIDLSKNFMGTTAIVANSIPLGVGLGLSAKLKNENRISTIFFGEGATEEGVFYESVNFSSVKNLPVLFICENNLYSVYSPLDVRQPKKRDISKMVQSMNIEVEKVNGSNVFSAYNAIKNSFEYVRKYKKPKFIEISTYRWREHCGPNFDNDIGYRTEKEFLYWKLKDPLNVMTKKIIKLTKKKNSYNEIKLKIEKEINSAFKFAENSPKPNQKSAYNGVYK